LALGYPDVGVSANYPVVIPTEVIDSIPHGILNVHGGDLPRYRGNACQAWAILNAEERVGLCVHKMEGSKLDSGDIISRDYFPLDASTSVTSIHRWITGRSPGLVLEALAAIEKNPSYILERQSESERTPLRCFPRRPEDARLDWSKSADEVVRLIKASSRPYRGAYCYLEGIELTVWDAVVFDSADEFMAVPGSLISVSDASKVVACGSGYVELLDYSFAGEENPKAKLNSVRQRLI
jgi:UDP-4-amino-4-deoxy-L-arabinose formyltransferase/UDP-glucuronic acid dehydrogenase (UDP-4-keto-hexauronic acid decarboxylating)